MWKRFACVFLCLFILGAEAGSAKPAQVITAAQSMDRSHPSAAPTPQASPAPEIPPVKPSELILDHAAQTGHANQADPPPAQTAQREIDPTKPMLALTFDDGPSGMVTDRILNILEAHQVQATFFVLGCQASARPWVLKRIAKLGHEIGIHAYSHRALGAASATKIQTEIAWTSAIVSSMTRTVPSLFRPPYGDCGGRVKAAANLPIILWSIDTEDWKSFNQDKVINAVLKKAADGSIILMHDIHATTADICAKLVPLLIEAEFQLVTVSELYTYKGIRLEAGVSYRKAD